MGIRSPRPAAGARVPARLAAAWPLVAILALAAGLRFWDFDDIGGNAFYDAAVRSMSQSWHNFFFGAYDPSAMAAIDKAPVDLWLQVASVKLLGFGSVALRLPEAIGSVAAVGLLYGTGRRLFGHTAGLAAAAALAVLPASVLTGRSDTMDSVMTALVVLAAWLIVRAADAPRQARVGWLVGAGAALGLAFNVKLTEALIPLPALALLAWLVLDGGAARRARALLAGATAFLLVAVAWLAAVALAPGPKPFPVGSRDGTAWNVVVVFDGLARLGLAPSGGPQPSTGGAGPLVLFGTSGEHLGTMIGIELLAALVAGGLALALARSSRSGGPRARAGAACVATWLATGIVVYSATAGLRTRYLEAIAPAVALALGGGVSALAAAATSERDGVRRLPLAALAGTVLAVGGLALAIAEPPVGALVVVGAALVTLVAAALVPRALASRPAGALATALAVTSLAGLLAIPVVTAGRIAGANASDAGSPGGMPGAQVARLSRYLAAHRGGARYELAVTAAAKAGPLIARDGQPVLVLTSAYGIPLVSREQIAAAVRAGEVRYVLMGGARCRPGHPYATGCAPAVRWARAHGIDVSRRAGMPRRGLLLRLHP